MPRRYGVEETCALLRDIGISDVRLFEENCVTGGDLIELEPADLKDSLNLSSLQVMISILELALPHQSRLYCDKKMFER